MKRVDETPVAGELWQLYDPYGCEFFDGYVVRSKSHTSVVLDVTNGAIVEARSTWFWHKIS
jgi:hypothetical protein